MGNNQFCKKALAILLVFSMLFSLIVVADAQFKGIDTEEIGDLAQFTDAERISDWAQNNVVWAVGKGLLTGKDNGVLDPLGNATRAEVAAMLQRFNETNVVSHESEVTKTADLDKVVPADEEKTTGITAALYDYFGTTGGVRTYS